MNGPTPPLADSALVAAARLAGFAGNALETLVAVVLAESGGDPDNVGDEHLVGSKWGPSIGLAQIRSLWAERGTGGTRDPDRLTDVNFNLHSAWTISSGGTSFTHWTAYTSGAYRKYLDRARAAVAGAPSSTSTSSTTRGLIGGFPGSGLFDDLPRIGVTAVLLAGGVALVVVGGWRSVERGAK